MTSSFASPSYWAPRIRSDLASFADPGSTVDLQSSGRDIQAVWEMRGGTRSDTFRVDRQGSAYKLKGRTKEPYRQFLAGPEMADLRTVATMIQRGSPKELFVPTRARREGDTEKDAIPLLQELVADEGSLDATRLIMVTGEAGGGKTRVLRELVRQQARAYLAAEADALFLYVNAQGRALARLNEALATELQDLRVGLTYHSVASLTRLGLLVPIIDGFDELLGVSGYDDAFSSLTSFLERLEGEGQLIASARSVYYEEEFRARAGRPAAAELSWEEAPVAICDWTERERSAYVDLVASRKNLSPKRRTALERDLTRVFSGPNESLAQKPFFLARTSELLLAEHTFDDGDDLLTQLVQGFLHRERQEKLLDRQQTPLLSHDDLDSLLCELALEMWNQETRELDTRSIREVAEYVLTIKEIPESTQQIVLERVLSLALLVRSPYERGLAFEHEAFFAYFLTRAIVDQYFKADADLRAVLGRSALPEDVANRIGAALWEEQESSVHLQHRADALGEAARQNWLRAPQVQQNAGLILLGLIRASAETGREVAGLAVRSVTFPGSHLRGVVCRECSFSDVIFRRTDLADTRFLNCRADDVMMIEPRVSSNTRLEFQGLDPGAHIQGLQLVNGAGNVLYDPDEVARAIADRGGPAPEGRNGRIQVDQKLMQLVERLTRAYGRANPVCEDDPRHKTVFSDRNWPAVRDLLLRHGIVTDEVRPTKGRPKRFLRRQFLPAEIMAGLREDTSTPLAIRRFWRELAEEKGR